MHKKTNQLRSFLDCDLTTVQTVCNVMTHYVLKADEEILQIYDIGSQLWNSFIADRKLMLSRNSLFGILSLGRS